jgi:hypothetical protein
MVTPLRGTKTPSGSIRVLKGVNYSESLPGNETTTLPEFPDAGNAVVWFDKTVTLQPVPGKEGVAVGETGPWNVSWSLSPVSADRFACNRPFELVSYIFKDKNLGYEYIMEKCKGGSAADVRNALEGMRNMEMQQKLQSLDIKKLDGRIVAPKVQGRFH